MGSASSKAARKLPTAKAKPSWAGARTGEPAAATANPAASRTPPSTKGPLASEHRSSTIEADASDPQSNPEFMRNLGRLGQVKVNHHMSTFRTQATGTQNMLRSRAESELQASSLSHAVRNRVSGPALAHLLSRRHDLPIGGPEIKAEAGRSGVDVEVLERVGRFVNVPIVRPGSEKRRVDGSGTEHVEMMAMWKAPAPSKAQAVA